MMRVLSLCVLLLTALVPATAGAQSPASRRVALVIGNGAYQQAGALRNPPNDARAMAELLRGAAFEVVLGIDLDRASMEARIREFGDKLEGAALGLLFYAGHGLQVGGENWLLPVDARLRRERDLAYEAVAIGPVLRLMETAATTNIVLLDACRDNPLAQELSRSMGTRSVAVGQGLAQVQSGAGTLVSFATQPGNVALDGEGVHSPFTDGLLRHLATPGLDVALAMRRVREGVMQATRQRQVPWDHSALVGDVVLVPAALPSPLASPVAPLPTPVDRETVFWQSAAAGGTRTDFEAYLAVYPQGAYAALARSRLASMPSQQPVGALPPSQLQTAAPRPVPPVSTVLLPPIVRSQPSPSPPPSTFGNIALPIAPPAASRPPPPSASQLAALGRPGWTLDPANGCWLWNEQPQPTQTASWSGACPNGPATGPGTLKSRFLESGRARLIHYVGTLRDGRLEGRGTLVAANGDRYEGEWRNGEKHGRGTQLWANGLRYDGEWQGGLRAGRGAQTWPSGDRYDGEWREDRRNGRGNYVWADGSRYEGAYRDDRPNGYGEYWSSQAGWHRGTWTMGCFREGSRRAAVGRPLAECP